MEFENFDYWEYENSIESFLMGKFNEFTEYLEDEGKECLIDALRYQGVRGLVKHAKEWQEESYIEKFIDQYDASEFMEYVPDKEDSHD